MYVTAASFATATTLGPLRRGRPEMRDQLGDHVGAVLVRAADDRGLALPQPRPAEEPETVHRRASVIVYRRTAVVHAVGQAEPAEIRPEAGGEDHGRDAAIDEIELARRAER